MLRLVRFCALIVCIVLPAQASAQTVFPPAFRIGLEPPPQMTVSQRFPGFEDADRRAIIAILDLPPGAYEQAEATIFDKEQRNIEDLKRESFPFESGIGFLASGKARAPDGTVVHKWLLLARSIAGPGAFNLTALLNVEVPEAARDVYTDEVVRKALTSVTFRNVPSEELLSLLPFKIENLSGFRVLEAMPGSVILTDGPGNDISTQPYMIISAQGGQPPDARDRERFARDLLRTSPLRDLDIRSSENLRINNGPAHEIRANAVGLTGNPVTFVQWVRYGTSGFLRVLGASRPEQWDDVFPRFRAVRDGISPK